MNYWLMKSEPDVFGIDDLIAKPSQQEHWDGVRNYQVRNMMRDAMMPGDLAFFYHSNAKPPGIAGVMEIISEGYPDHTAWDLQSKYYDSGSTMDNPRWYMVDVQFKKKFKRFLSLDELKKIPGLEGFTLLKKGSRLSVMPVEKDFWELIMDLAER